MITQKRTLYFVLGALSLVLIPLISMQFQIGGWDWQMNDFVIMAILLSFAGFALAAATNKDFPLNRRVIGVAVVGFLLVIYVHLAVGLVDSWPLAGS